MEKKNFATLSHILTKNNEKRRKVDGRKGDSQVEIPYSMQKKEAFHSAFFLRFAWNAHVVSDTISACLNWTKPIDLPK